MKWGRMLPVLILGLVLGAAAPVGAEDHQDLPRWGAGWLGLDGAPTVRFRIGAWQLGLAARPNDQLDYYETWHQDYQQAEPDSVRNVPQDDKQESGWVRLDVARPVASWETVDLPVLLAFSYGWSDEQDSYRAWNESDGGWSTNDIKRYTNSYSLTLGLRPTWRLRRWVSLECEFGVRYRWQNYDQEEKSTSPNQESARYYWREGHGSSFVSYGPSSGGSTFGIFNLVFWF